MSMSAALAFGVMSFGVILHGYPLAPSSIRSKVLLSTSHDVRIKRYSLFTIETTVLSSKTHIYNVISNPSTKTKNPIPVSPSASSKSLAQPSQPQAEDPSLMTKSMIAILYGGLKRQSRADSTRPAPSKPTATAPQQQRH